MIFACIAGFMLLLQLGLGFSDAVSADEEEDWPMFRLDYVHTGHKEGLAPDTNQTLWTFNTTTNNRWIVSSPMIVDDYVYIGSENGKLYKLNLADGTEVWNYTADENGAWSHFWSSPYVDLENNMVLCHADGVHAIDLTTGERIWHFASAVREFSSPVVHDGVVFVGSYDNCIYALPQTDPNGDGNITNDEIVWIYYSGEYQNGARVDETGGAVSTTLAIVNGMVFGAEQTQLDSGSQYCDYNAFAIPEVDPDGSGEIEHGEIIWKYEIGEHLPVIDTGVPGEGGDCFSSPSVDVDAGHVYIGSRDTFVYCLAIEPQDDFIDNDGDGISGNEGEMIWRAQVDNEVYSSPSVHNGSVFIGSGMYATNGSPGTMYCFDQTDGTEIWTHPHDDGFLSSPLVADGKVYIGSNNDIMFCFDEVTGDVLWTYTAETTANQDAFGSSPSLYEDIIVIGNCNGLVYAFHTPRVNYAPEIDLIGPEDGVKLSNQGTVILQWDGTDQNPADTLTYDVYLSDLRSDVENKETVALVSIGGTETSYQPAALEDGEKYYWEVVVSDGEYETTSEIWEFTINAPPTIILENPTDGFGISTTEIILGWAGEDDDGEDIEFDLYFDNSSDPTTLIGVNLTEDEFSIDDLEDGMTYYWKVAVKDEFTTEMSEVWSFTVNIEAATNVPPTIELLSPEDTAVLSVTSTTLSWQAADDDGDELMHSLFFDTDTDPSTMVSKFSTKKYDGSSYDTGNLDDGVTYYWKVTVSDGMQEITSPVWSFRIDMEYISNSIPEIDLLSPLNGQVLETNSLQLVWKASDDDRNDDLSFDVYLGLDENSTVLVSNDQDTKVYQAIGLEYGKTFFWYVVVSDGTDEVSSDVRSFTIEEEIKDDKDDDKSLVEEITDEPIYIGGIGALIVVFIAVGIFLIIRKRSYDGDYYYDDWEDEDDW